MNKAEKWIQKNIDAMVSEGYRPNKSEAERIDSETYVFGDESKLIINHENEFEIISMTTDFSQMFPE